MFGAGEPRLRRPTARGREVALEVRGAVDRGRLSSLIEALAEPRGRDHAPEAMARADALILSGFQEAGWDASVAPFVTFRDPTVNIFASRRRARPAPAATLEEVRGANVVAIREGADPRLAREVYVVVAHHDTVPGSPGADDNGASVAALLEIARVLGPGRFRRTIVLAAVDLEETGLHGSRELVDRLSERWRVAGAIVFDTMAYTARDAGTQRLPAGLDRIYPGQIGRMRSRDWRGDWTGLLYQARSAILARTFAEAIATIEGDAAVMLVRDPIDLPLLGRVLGWRVPAARDFVRSDHRSFWDRSLPAIQVTDTADFRNPHYHTAGDLPETIDLERLTTLTAAAVLALRKLAEPLPVPGAA